MKFSNAKIIHMSNVIIDGLLDLEGVGFKKDIKDVRRVISRIIEEELKKEELIEKKVQDSLAKNKKLKQGSREYDEEFRKRYNEEMQKKGLK